MKARDGLSGLSRIPWRWVQWVAISIAVVGLGFRLWDLGGGNWATVSTTAAHQFVPVVLILMVSVGLRLRSTIQVLAAALGGFFSCTWLAYHLGTWLTGVMGPDDPLRLTLAIPVLEEASKALLLLLIAWTWRRKAMLPGVVDLGLAGMAVGAGFAFHEDLLWGRVSSSGFDWAGGWLLPSVHTETGLVAGHVVWTGLIGLAVGVAVTRRWRWAWVTVAAAAVLAVVDHGTWNDASVRESWGWAVGWGWLPIVVFTGGLLLAFVTDTRSVRTSPAEQRILPWEVVRYARTGQVASPVRRWHSATEMMRFTTGTAHARAAAIRDTGLENSRGSASREAGRR